MIEAKCNKKKNLKNSTIHKIWGEGNGVISLHMFHNIDSFDAYTREAAIIDAIGVSNITNLKRGSYYGTPKTENWTYDQKCLMGSYLLYKAYHIFLNDSCIQLRSDNF